MDPKVTQKLEEDVSFVRQAVEQRDERPVPRAGDHRPVGGDHRRRIYSERLRRGILVPVLDHCPCGWFLGQLRPRYLAGKKTGSPHVGAGESDMLCTGALSSSQ